MLQSDCQDSDSKGGLSALGGRSGYAVLLFWRHFARPAAHLSFQKQMAEFWCSLYLEKP